MSKCFVSVALEGWLVLHHLIKGLAHLQILVSVEAPGTNPPWITKDTCVYKLQVRKENHSTETLNGTKLQLGASQC